MLPFTAMDGTGAQRDTPAPEGRSPRELRGERAPHKDGGGQLFVWSGLADRTPRSCGDKEQTPRRAANPPALTSELEFDRSSGCRTCPECRLNSLISSGPRRIGREPPAGLFALRSLARNVLAPPVSLFSFKPSVWVERKSSLFSVEAHPANSSQEELVEDEPKSKIDPRKRRRIRLCTTREEIFPSR